MTHSKKQILTRRPCRQLFFIFNYLLQLSEKCIYLVWVVQIINPNERVKIVGALFLDFLQVSAEFFIDPHIDGQLLQKQLGAGVGGYLTMADVDHGHKDLVF